MLELMAPFYITERVIAVDALPGSKIINGHQYTITCCHYSPSGNPIAHGKSFWYVGVSGIDNNWLRPSIFASLLPDMQEITFEEIKEKNPVSVN